MFVYFSLEISANEKDKQTKKIKDKTKQKCSQMYCIKKKKTIENKRNAYDDVIYQLRFQIEHKIARWIVELIWV